RMRTTTLTRHAAERRLVSASSALAFSVIFLLPSFCQAQKISPAEQKLLDYIDAHTAEAVTLLEKTVNIESPTENLAGVRQVGVIFKTEFETLGFTTKW